MPIFSSHTSGFIFLHLNFCSIFPLSCVMSSDLLNYLVVWTFLKSISNPLMIICYLFHILNFHLYLDHFWTFCSIPWFLSIHEMVSLHCSLTFFFFFFTVSLAVLACLFFHMNLRTRWFSSRKKKNLSVFLCESH